MYETPELLDLKRVRNQAVLDLTHYRLAKVDEIGHIAGATIRRV